VAGLGTVGRAVIRLLQDDSERLHRQIGTELDLTTVFDRSHKSKEVSWLPPTTRLTDSVEEFLASPADIVVELIGGEQPADRIIREGLGKKRAVVTANKQLMAAHGASYLELAEANRAYLGFEASVAGGIPILRTLRRSLSADRIVSIRGILNGTCNFILTEMADSRREQAEVLAQAQALGYAEADPTLDVSGRDTADKLVILAALAFGRWARPDQVAMRGITEIDSVDFLYAQRLGATIRMLGVAERSDRHVSMWVSPCLVDDRLTLSKISGVVNAVEITGARLGATLFSGPGAGGDPTAVSVVGDILNAARWWQGETVFTAPRVEETVSASADDQDFAPRGRLPFYLRFLVEDRPGIIARLAQILANHGINIDSVLQESWTERERLPFVISIDPTLHATVEMAVAEMNSLDFVLAPPVVLPILRN
jgi:homoserine dehydrogenase